MPNNLDADAADLAIRRLQGPVRLRTLTMLRWLAVAGQTAAIAVVHFGLGYPTPLGLCLGVIALSAWLNLFVTLRFSPQRTLNDDEATGFIAFDIIQLCALLFLTGGLLNPFSALIIAPVTIAASLLPARMTVLLAALAIVGVSVLAAVHLPLPWRPGETVTLPGVYTVGVWVALAFTIGFFAAYAHRIAAESAQMKSALAATQLVLSREERLAALGGLAAAAAHELGTPLATIQLTAKEMARDLRGHGGHLEEDAMLLVSQAERCRNILGLLSERGDAGDAVLEKITVEALLREAAEPFLGTADRPEILFLLEPPGDGETLTLRRQPETLYGLRNFIENAVEYCRDHVLIHAAWDAETLSIHVHDDGGGFTADVLARLGEPYLGGRVRSANRRSHEKTRRSKTGLGLGFFISKTLLERIGAVVEFDNAPWPAPHDRKGAWVSVSWRLADIVHPG